MTLEDYQRDPAKREALKHLMESPEFVHAVTAAKLIMEPKVLESTDASPVLAASKYQQLAGANELLKRMYLLTKDPVVRKQPTLKSLARSREDLPQ